MKKTDYKFPLTQVSAQLQGEKLLDTVVESHEDGDPSKMPGGGFAPGRIPL